MNALARMGPKPHNFKFARTDFEQQWQFAKMYRLIER